jgi:hypothetical protein
VDVADSVGVDFFEPGVTHEIGHSGRPVPLLERGRRDLGELDLRGDSLLVVISDVANGP